jgi:hypothetical protein
MASRRQRRRREQQQRRALPAADDTPLAPLAYSREQAAQLLGISLATLDRRVVPTIATVKTGWGARLIPVEELERYLVERRDVPRAPRPRREQSGRKPILPPVVVDRIRSERARGSSLAAIARRLNHDGIPTAQGGRQWWPSTLRTVLARATRLRSASSSGTEDA